MTILVLGATGATGILLVRELLNREQKVKVIVRSPDKLPDSLKSHENLSVTQASVLELDEAELMDQIRDCDTIASCLGHNPTLKGLFGAPRRLVTEATRRLCRAIKMNNPDRPIKFVLMNTAGNRNRDIQEHISFGQKFVIQLLRLLLPPHKDNEEAADFLRKQIRQNDKNLEWAVVRPDNLIDKKEVSPYKVYASPIRSAIFNAGSTSRINVAHFMANLITNETTWETWKGQMPVIYNKKSTEHDQK